MSSKPAIAFIGCAGWGIPKASGHLFPGEGSHLQRYAAVFPAVEINSSFYRSHRPSTYARWADSVPADFRFSVKMPKSITHTGRLVDVDDLLHDFAIEIAALGMKLGCVLVQLPPSLAFDESVATTFFERLRTHVRVRVALEPRHPSWFSPHVEAFLESHRIARVAADPAVVPEAAVPGGWAGACYYRWHGSPRTYYSSYSEARLQSLATDLLHNIKRGAETWCVLDNTAQGAATANARSVLGNVRRALHSPPKTRGRGVG